MARYLRTVSTRRLLALIAGLLTAIIAGTAIAIAAAGHGPVAPRKPLAQAIRGALGARAVPGITARIKFTNHLIDASNLQGSDPILSGATGRLWLSPSGHRMRLELQSDTGDAQVVFNNGSWWIYDPSSNTVYRGRLAAGAHKAAAADAGKAHKLPTVAQIRSDIGKLAQRAEISGAIPGDIAGHAAYTVRIGPKHSAGLLGAGELAWDAVRGIPLRIAIYARNDSSPVLELRATDISYGSIPTGDFNVRPPQTAKVVRVATPSGSGAHGATREHAGRARHHQVTGVSAVAARLPFKLHAARSLVGLRRRSVTLLDWGGTPGALVTYGQNLGGIAVFEIKHKAGESAARPAPAHGDHPGLSLPTVSINGITGQELDTALGTMVRFTRGGVSYIVVGSVPPVAADQAARAL